ncbi:hypothetical protein COB18_00950 [Candidatus Kaiserbacteria bacterium]|nr:MAG: hypothetical protein COB18_00950 [Candidatus Kaiserbacteria bacterium]
MDILQNQINKTSERLDTIARNIIVVIVFLLPLIALPTDWIPFAFVKSGFFALGIFTSLMLWSVARLKEHKVEFPQSNILWTAVLLVVGYFLAAILSGNVIQSLIGFGFERDTVLAMLTLVAALAVVALTTRKVIHFIRLQQAALAAFLILGIFQILRIVIGADVVFPSIFSNDATATLLGNWNDLAVFSGLVLLMALSGLALFSARAIRAGLYVALTVALFLLIVVNLSSVWATLVFAIFLLAVYVVADASYDRESGTFNPRIPWKKLLPSAVVLGISIIFLIGGSAIGQKINSAFDIAFVDVRPSWEGTISVGARVFENNALLGSGPNTFRSDWVAYKAPSVNETEFWNAEFDFGIGLIPTAFITGGLVVGLLWLLFFASFIHLGIRLLSRRITQPAHMYIIISSYIGATYLLILSVIYVPQTVMLAYTFILVGTVIAAARISGVITTREIEAKKSYATGLALTGVTLLIFIIAFGAFVVNGERTRAGSSYARAISIASSGDLDRAERVAARASISTKDIREAQILTNIGLIRLSDVLNAENEDVEAQRELFQQQLTRTISTAQTVVALDEDDYQNWMLLADIYSQLVPLNIEGAYESAVASYREAQVHNSANPLIPISLARLALSEDRIEEARGYIEEALELKSNYTDAYYLLSQIAILEGDTAAAIESTEIAVVLRPTNTGLLFQLGVLQYEQREYEKAVLVLERAVTLNSNYSNALYFLGLAYEQVGNTESSLLVFERIGALNPENIEIQEVIASLKDGGSAIDILGKESTEASSELPISE